MALYARDSYGAYRVLLSAKDRRWAEYVYEFAHELGHIVTNFGRHAAHGQPSPHQWFEEAVCELISVLTLSRVAQDWRAHEPWAGAAEDAAQLERFLALLLREPHRRAPEGVGAAEWLRDRGDRLRADPYARPLNETVAAMLQHWFEREPQQLASLTYLNSTSLPVPSEFADFLQEWCDRAPPEHQAFVRRLHAFLVGQPESTASR